MTWQENHITIKDGKRIGKNPLKDGIYKYKAPNRSLDINAYYWVCIQIIVDEYANYGYIHTINELHRLFKKGLLPRVRIYGENKKSYVYQRQTTKNLSNKRFSKYLSDIKLIAEHGKLHKIPGLEEISGFIIPDSN